MVFEPTGVEDPASRDFEAGRDDRLTQCKRCEASSVGLELRACSAVNRPAHATACNEIFIGGVDDRITVELPHEIALDCGNLCVRRHHHEMGP